MASNKYFFGRPLLFVTLLSAIIALSCATSSTRLFAHTISIPIGVPDIGWDSTVPGPILGPGGGITTFTPLIAFTITGTVSSFTPSVIPGPLLVGGSVSIATSLVPASVSVLGGAVTHADFTGGTITILDSVGALALSGSITDMYVHGTIGTNQGSGALIYTVVPGGYLDPDFIPPGLGGAVFLEFNRSANWVGLADYAAAWTAETKGNTSPIPEPGTIALLGTGLLGMLAYGRKRFWKKG